MEDDLDMAETKMGQHMDKIWKRAINVSTYSSCKRDEL